MLLISPAGALSARLSPDVTWPSLLLCLAIARRDPGAAPDRSEVALVLCLGLWLNTVFGLLLAGLLGPCII